MQKAIIPTSPEPSQVLSTISTLSMLVFINVSLTELLLRPIIPGACCGKRLRKIIMAAFRKADPEVSFLSKIGNIGLRVLWHIIHLLVSVYYLVVGIACVLESWLISTTGLCGFDSTKIKYLAVVIESEEASDISRVVKLLSWLHSIGVNQICLYDEQGVLKKLQKDILEKFENVILKQDSETEKLVSSKDFTLEFASFTDGKEAVVKAAELLFRKYVGLADSEEDRREQIFTEAHLSDALKAIGSNGLEPDLLLVYGPERCHLGFPAWRIRYTEIVHMGSLASMRFGSLVKALHKFTMVRQNYGK